MSLEHLKSKEYDILIYGGFMEIKSRKQAQLEGESKYYTGEVCKNGHLDYRYVKSGACRSCLNTYQSGTASTDRVLEQQRRLAVAEDNVLQQIEKVRLAQERKSFVDSMVQAKFFIPYAEVATFMSVAYAYAQLRFEGLSESDVNPKLAPLSPTIDGSIHRVYCHIDDVQALRDFADTLRPQKPVMDVWVKTHGSVIARQMRPVELPPDVFESKPGDPDYKG